MGTRGWVILGPIARSLGQGRDARIGVEGAVIFGRSETFPWQWLEHGDPLQGNSEPNQLEVQEASDISTSPVTGLGSHSVPSSTTQQRFQRRIRGPMLPFLQHMLSQNLKTGTRR